MRNGTVLVEQVENDGSFVKDYDSILSQKEIAEQLSECIPNIEKKYAYIGEYKSFRFAMKITNINYLGNPHPINKKRIQISSNLQDFYHLAKSEGLYPLLFGIYSYNKNIVFVDFHIEDYVRKNSHNSSAHVLTEDISDAMKTDIFQKFDNKLNKITIFRKEYMEKYFETLLDYIKEEEKNNEIINSI